MPNASRVSASGRLWLVIGLLACLAIEPAARAQSTDESRVVLDQPRILLSDLIESDLGDLGALDLGPTPPPGRTRIVTRAHVQRAIVAAGEKFDVKRIPAITRVDSASRLIKPAELSQAVEPLLRGQLKAGVELQKMKITRTVRVAPRARIGSVSRPRVPRREGVHQLTTTVGIVTDGSESQRIPIGYAVLVTPEGALPDVSRGAEIQLVIQRGAARISADAVALSDADIGEVISFRVKKTRALLRAKLTSTSSATVVGK